jgi:hypothetical protein
MGCCGHGNELPLSTKEDEFLDYLLKVLRMHEIKQSISVKVKKVKLFL